MTADPFVRAAALTTCRDRRRQFLQALDDGALVHPQDLPTEVARTSCPAGHELHIADLTGGGLVRAEDDGCLRLAKEGSDWLLEHGRPSPDWGAATPAGVPPLRAWQEEALHAWASHGRHGVIEAVTGTGKSRVGVEATREALADDFNVVVIVPTSDLVDQWVKTLRMHAIHDVGALVGGSRASFRTDRVVVGTVQSLYTNPQVREDGKVLVVADEAHRYGAGQWSKALHESYRRRLGLTATFERNDDGIQGLLAYFGGPPVYSIGFRDAIAQGVVSQYDVKLLGVPLDTAERAKYDEADKIARDARLQLLAADFPAEPFGAFLHAVQVALKDEDDPTVSDVARRYLKAFSQRIEIMSGAQAKVAAMRNLERV